MTDQINISSTINNGNPLQHFDQIIALRTIKTIEKLFNSFDRKNLLLLIMLFGADFIKKELTNVLSSVYQTMKKKVETFEFKQFLAMVWKSLHMTWKKLRLYKNVEIVDEICVDDELNYININFIPNNIFYENLYSYLQSNSDIVTYDSSNILLSQCGKNDYENTIKISNIKIEYGETIISIENCIQYVVSLKNDTNKFKSCSLVSKFMPDVSKSEYADLLEFLPLHNLRKDLLPYIHVNDPEIKRDDSGAIIFSRDLAFAIHAKYNMKCRIIDTYRTITRLCMLLNSTNVSTDKLPDRYTCRFRLILPPVGTVLNFLGIATITIKAEYFELIHVNKFKRDEIRQQKEFKEMFNNSIDSKLMISLENKNKDIDLNRSWISFMEQLNSKTSDLLMTTESNDIDIYDIKLTIKKNIIQEAAPKQTIKRKINDGKDEEEVVVEAIEEKSELETIITCDNINSTYKDFTTLYLKKHDHHALSTTLCNFKHKKNIYRDLGLPYKFGVLLHGEPGTGKSSAILAIASYLQKDIYYLDFNNIKTNEDLKAVFNKVNNEMSDNGIIVMEDIDVMTNIVHDRSLNHYENTELTLECFLNLLQGSLTRDGSVFIATTNNINILDPAFVRDGRFDVKVHLESCDHFQMNEIYNKFFSRSIPEDMLITIPELKITPAKFIARLLPYILTEVSDEIIIENILRE